MRLTCWFVAMAILPTCAAQGQNQDCQCTGNPFSHQPETGRGGRIVWTFQPYQITGPVALNSAAYCYHKKIENVTTLEVRNIYWPAANFIKRFISANSVIPECITRVGNIDASPKPGVLYFGISDRMDTISWEPSGGWKQIGSSFELITVAQAQPRNVVPLNRGPLAPLRSEFTLETSSSRHTWIVVTSSVERPTNGMLKLVNRVENKGDSELSISIDLLRIGGRIAPNSIIENITMHPETTTIVVQNAIVRILSVRPKTF